MQLLVAAKQSGKFSGFDGSPAAAKKVVAGEADLAIVYNGDALNAMKEDKTNGCDYVVPAEGSVIWVDTMVVTSHAPNAAAMSAISEESRKNPRIYPPDDQLKWLSYLQDVGEATGVYDEVWTAVKSR
jgi:spermidine/putrescine transport system substrate-binding protein